MNQTNQDHESKSLKHPARSQLIVVGAWVLAVAMAAVVTSVLPELADPVGIVIAGLGPVVCWWGRNV
jgi:hypothetical protein